MGQNSTIIPLQYLRALAAGIVVISHAGHQAHFLYDTPQRIFNFGAIGVDIFFIISGFIMMLVSETKEADARNFILKRFVRIMPVYWLAVGFYLAMDLFFKEFEVVSSLDQVVKSLAIWGTHDSNVVIGVAWTLRFEWAFYACFAMALALSHKHRAIFAGIGLLIVVAALNYHKNDGSLLDQMRQWSGAFYEFIYGMAAYSVWRGNPFFSNRTPIDSKALSAALVAVILVLSIIFLFQFGSAGAWKPVFNHKQLSWGLPALAVFISWITLFSRFPVSGPANRILLHYGDASFTLYLIHFPIVIVLRKLDVLEPLWRAGGFWVFVLTSTAIVFAAASFAYVAVERPALALVRSILLKPKPKAAGAEGAA